MSYFVTFVLWLKMGKEMGGRDKITYMCVPGIKSKVSDQSYNLIFMLLLLNVYQVMSLATHCCTEAVFCQYLQCP